MKLEIRGLHVEITESLHSYAHRSLGFALDRFAERISNVRLKVGDLNGSRGGVDKRCQLAISMAHSSPIILESRASTIQGAIDRIAAKVCSLVERHLIRRHEQRRCRQDTQLLGVPPAAVANLRPRGGSLP